MLGFHLNLIQLTRDRSRQQLGICKIKHHVAFNQEQKDGSCKVEIFIGLNSQFHVMGLDWLAKSYIEKATFGV